ncbi:MAG TPA: hypothetical protein VHW71_04245 [Steroidobacteraceae bacterium]|jgi:hypothetical protein|nr:hypothetical protein [Steroidobacteraceae bacterium]
MKFTYSELTLITTALKVAVEQYAQDRKSAIEAKQLRIAEQFDRQGAETEALLIRFENE